MNINGKILSILSILLILIVMTGTVSAATSAAEKKQDSRLAALESSVQQILTRLTVVENKLLNIQTPPYSAIFSKYYDTGGTQITYSPDRVNLANLTFNLPKDAYVQADVGGYLNLNLAQPNSDALLILYVDGDATWCKIGYAYYSVSNMQDFHLSKSFYLPAGTHTIYLDGWVLDPSVWAIVNGVTITAIATEQGSMEKVLTNPNCASLTSSSIANGKMQGSIR